MFKKERKKIGETIKKIQKNNSNNVNSEASRFRLLWKKNRQQNSGESSNSNKETLQMRKGYEPNLEICQRKNKFGIIAFPHENY